VPAQEPLHKVLVLVGPQTVYMMVQQLQEEVVVGIWLQPPLSSRGSQRL
jgi:hypothetical protein